MKINQHLIFFTQTTNWNNTFERELEKDFNVTHTFNYQLTIPLLNNTNK